MNWPVHTAARCWALGTGKELASLEVDMEFGCFERSHSEVSETVELLHPDMAVEAAVGTMLGRT